jgi:2-haloacid dehalogenase
MTDHSSSDPAPKALVFDVFGTVVDWHGSIAREAGALFRERGIAVDPVAFTEAWRAGYRPAMQRVRTGALPWMKIDDLHRLILDALVTRFAIAGLGEADLEHLNRVWHRLDPWPDTVDGLGLLKRRFTISTLSNGHFALLTNMAKRAGLPWDCVISAELFHHYKPDPETYRGAADLLGIAHHELMRVACHPDDRRAAQVAGLRAAYVKRPAECGIGGPQPTFDDGEFDDVADDFVELARRFETRWFAVR